MARSWFSLKNVKTFVEVLAVIGAGIWSVFIYFNPTFPQKMVNKLAIEQARHKLEARIRIDPKVESRYLGPARNGEFAYDTQYSYAINVTSASTVSIEVVALEWFVGAVVKNDARYFRANLPTQNGAIKWKSLGIEVHSVPKFDAEKLKGLIGQDKSGDREIVALDDEKGGAGIYFPEEVITEYRTIHVEATPDKWLGFALVVGVRNSDGTLEQYYDEQHVHLAAITAPLCGPQLTAKSPAGG